VRAAILGVGTVPLGCEIHQLAREIADAFQELCIVWCLADARDRRWIEGLNDAICRAAASRPTSGILARVVWMLVGKRLVQRMYSK
jgi:hypothetical protein